MNIALAIMVDPFRRLTLIAQRPHDSDHLASKWEFPGGKIEAGESAVQCALREAHEETGLKPHLIEAWPPVDFEYPERSVVLHPFLCEADPGIKFDRRWLWVPIADLGDYDFPEANAPLIERLCHFD